MCWLNFLYREFRLENTNFFLLSSNKYLSTDLVPVTESGFGEIILIIYFLSAFMEQDYVVWETGNKEVSL